jgi:hypothetical protein
MGSVYSYCSYNGPVAGSVGDMIVSCCLHRRDSNGFIQQPLFSSLGSQNEKNKTKRIQFVPKRVSVGAIREAQGFIITRRALS